MIHSDCKIANTQYLTSFILMLSSLIRINTLLKVMFNHNYQTYSRLPLHLWS